MHRHRAELDLFLLGPPAPPGLYRKVSAEAGRELREGEVASLATDPKEVGRYGQGAVVAKASGSTPMAVAVDWFYLRRELPR